MVFGDEAAKKVLVGKNRKTQAGIEPVSAGTVESVELATRLEE